MTEVCVRIIIQPFDEFKINIGAFIAANVSNSARYLYISSLNFIVIVVFINIFCQIFITISFPKAPLKYFASNNAHLFCIHLGN